jgi:dihydrolipoamide dehydrogenase
LSKLLVDPKTDMILGVGLVGPGAGELISEAVVAIEMGATAKDLALCIHPHPTLTETLSEAAETLHGLASHFFVMKKKVV